MTKVSVNLDDTRRLEVSGNGMETYDTFRKLSSVFEKGGMTALEDEMAKFSPDNARITAARPISLDVF